MVMPAQKVDPSMTVAQTEGRAEGGTAGPVAGTCSIFDGQDLNGWA